MRLIDSPGVAVECGRGVGNGWARGNEVALPWGLSRARRPSLQIHILRRLPLRRS